MKKKHSHNPLGRNKDASSIVPSSFARENDSIRRGTTYITEDLQRATVECAKEWCSAVSETRSRFAVHKDGERKDTLAGPLQSI
jgi:hypothetical protein